MLNSGSPEDKGYPMADGVVQIRAKFRPLFLRPAWTSRRCARNSPPRNPLHTQESLSFTLINTVVTESSSSIAQVGFEQFPLPMLLFTGGNHLEPTPQAADDLPHLTLDRPLDGKLARTAGYQFIIVVVVPTGSHQSCGGTTSICRTSSCVKIPYPQKKVEGLSS